LGDRVVISIGWTNSKFFWHQTVSRTRYTASDSRVTRVGG
jgi:hypothetical protein